MDGVLGCGLWVEPQRYIPLDYVVPSFCFTLFAFSWDDYKE